MVRKPAGIPCHPQVGWGPRLHNRQCCKEWCSHVQTEGATCCKLVFTCSTRLHLVGEVPAVLPHRDLAGVPFEGRLFLVWTWAHAPTFLQLPAHPSFTLNREGPDMGDTCDSSAKPCRVVLEDTTCYLHPVNRLDRQTSGTNWGA